MTSTPKSRPLIQGGVPLYTSFLGIDRSRPRTAMETLDRVTLWQSKNAHSDLRGIIRSDAPLLHRSGTSTGIIKAVRFLSRNSVVWAEQKAGGLLLQGQRGDILEDIYDRDAVINFTNYRRRVLALSRGYDMVKFDGYTWQTSETGLTPGFGVPIQGRLAVAGLASMPAEVLLSRLDNEDVFRDQETSADDAVRAGSIDVTNLIGTNDEITGLGVMDVNRLVIFTADQALIYVIDPAINQWSIDQRANIRIGCASHGSISNVGLDLVYCSSYGVHAITRTDQNVTQSVTLSRPIETVYRRLAQRVPNTEEISSFYDQSLGFLHIFFPDSSGVGADRLTVFLGAGFENMRWSYGDSLFARCGDYLGGQTVFGTGSGVYDQLDPGVSSELLRANGAYRADIDVQTPIMWMGDTEETKRASHLIVRASGSGTLRVEAADEEGNPLTTREFDIEGEDDTDDTFPDITLSRQYRVPFNVRFRGLQLRFTSTGVGKVELIGYGVQLVTESPGKR